MNLIEISLSLLADNEIVEDNHIPNIALLNYFFLDCKFFHGCPCLFLKGNG